MAWYVRNIHGQDANQTRYCITDCSDDKQIDAIVIDDDPAASAGTPLLSAAAAVNSVWNKKVVLRSKGKFEKGLP